MTPFILPSLPRLIYISHHQGHPQAFYYNDVVSYVLTISYHRRVVVTGHSLGGGISKISSALTGVPVVAISAPGIGLSSRAFGVSVEALNEVEVNLINDVDFVPKLDRLQVTNDKDK